jgi:molybdopterin-binding protein
VNQLAAIVKEIEKTEAVTYIRVEIGDTTLCLIKPKTPQWLSVGDQVTCTFQETSVCVSKECPGKVSIENRLPATLKEVRQGASLCELTFESEMGEVISLITAHAYETLGLTKGCEATMLLRGVDLDLEPVLTPIDLDAYCKVLNRTKVAN